MFASARLAERDVDHAAALSTRAHDIAASARSPRIMRSVLELRQRMAPFRQTLAVQALDEHLLAGR